MTQLDLLTLNYPKRPGAKRSRASHESAERVAPYDGPLRQQAYEWLCEHVQGGTARDIAQGIRPDLNIQSADFEKLVRNVAPRLSQMLALGKVRRAPELEEGATSHKYYAVGVQ